MQLQVCPTALVQQVPYFERVNPEGLCIATYMNASTNVGVLSAAVYFLVIRYVCPIPHSVSVPFILASSTTAAYLAAAVYPDTIGGVSVFLFACCAIGGSAGSLASVVMNPFLTQFKNDFITASRSGGSMCIVLTALLAAIQNPGSDRPRFSTTYYMLMVAILLSMPMFAFLHITRNGLGLRWEDDGLANSPACVDDDSNLFSDRKDVIHSSDAHDADRAIGVGSNNPIFLRDRSGSDGSFQYIEQETTTKSLLHSGGNSSSNVPENEHRSGNNKYVRSSVAEDGTRTIEIPRTPGYFDLFYYFPNLASYMRPWVRQVLPLCAVMGFVNMNTWGILTAVSPFAFRNVSTDSGARTLGVAYELGAVCLMLGDLSTAAMRLPSNWALLSFSLLTCGIYIAAVPSPMLLSPVAAPLLVMFFAVGRFFEAHLVTSMYRKIATDFRAEDRENAARVVGIVDQISTTIGSIASSILVAKYATC